jgi:hypothetical protein
VSDKISCRLAADTAQALSHHLQNYPGETISAVVNAALRAYLEASATPDAGPSPDVWEAIAAINQRLDALEAARPAVRPPSDKPQRKSPSQPAAKPMRATVDGLLTDADVAERLGRSRRGFQNSVRAAGLTDGDVYEGFRIVRKVVDPQLGGPPRRVWELAE